MEKNEKEESRLMQLYLSKQSFLERYWGDNLIAILKQWQDSCKNFCDFEELYVIVQSTLIPKDFYFDWLNSTEIYEEKLQVYSCAMKAFDFWFGQELIRTWVDQLCLDPKKTLNDRSRSKSLIYREDEEFGEELREGFRNELEKILKIY